MSQSITPIASRVSVQGVETDRDKKSVKGTLRDPETVSALISNARKTSDTVNINLTSQVDAESLRSSLSVVMDKVAHQMMRLFPDDPELRQKLGLPEDIENFSMEDIQDYFSPEKTAQRILGFTTGFLGAYQLNHAEEDESEQVTGFGALIRDAIEKGFDEAIKTLGGTEQLGEIGKTIRETYDKVMAGLEEFIQSKLKLLGTEKEENDPLEATIEIPPLEVPEITSEETTEGQSDSYLLDVTA
jgi:hypothetical protein